MNSIKYSLFRPEDEKMVLALIERSDNTSRTEATWKANNLTAVLAFNDQELIGAIPLEPREFQIGSEDCLNLLWVSGAHVDSEYRSKGIGAKLDAQIKEHFKEEFDAIFVYRQDENSQAYRWYQKRGYTPLMPILAFKKSISETDGSILNSKVYSTQEEFKKIDRLLYNCFNLHSSHLGGFPKRTPDFWSKKLAGHYYQAFYKYYILTKEEAGVVLGYAVLGLTDMKDGISRFDILEFISPQGEFQKDFLREIEKFALELGLKEIRIQLSFEDPLIDLISESGFIFRWRTNIMGVFIDPASYLNKKLGDVVSFTLETPSCGKMEIGKDSPSFELFGYDETLNRLLAGRISFQSALNEGLFVFLGTSGNKVDFINKMEKVFSPKSWRYFQIDYI